MKKSEARTIANKVWAVTSELLLRTDLTDAQDEAIDDVRVACSELYEEIREGDNDSRGDAILELDDALDGLYLVCPDVERICTLGEPTTKPVKKKKKKVSWVRYFFYTLLALAILPAIFN